MVYVPKSLKPILGSMYTYFMKSRYYRIYKKITYHPKERENLHDYWKHPWEYGNINKPSYYLNCSAERSIFLVELFKNHFNKEDTFIEIGCNVGRNLNHLFEAGFKNLNGIEINKDAIELLKESYPEMANEIEVYNQPVEDIIKDFKDNQFDVVYTMAVLEHIHTDSEWVFSEMVRIAQNYVVTIEDEKSYSWRHFPRNYQNIFESLRMKEITVINCKEIEGLGSEFYARVFKKTDSDTKLKRELI